MRDLKILLKIIYKYIYFKSRFENFNYPGFCSLISIPIFFKLNLNFNEYKFLREFFVEQAHKTNYINDNNWLFEPYDWRSRRKWLKEYIKTL